MHYIPARTGSDPTSPAIYSTVSIHSDSADMVTIHPPCEISRGTEESTCSCCLRLCRAGQHPRRRLCHPLRSSNYRHLLYRHSQNLFSRRDLCNPKRRQRGRRRAHRPILPSSCFLLLLLSKCCNNNNRSTCKMRCDKLQNETLIHSLFAVFPLRLSFSHPEILRGPMRPMRPRHYFRPYYRTMIRSASRTAARSLVQLRPPTAYPTLVTTRSYHENIVEHYESPRNVGSLPKDDEDVGTGESSRVESGVVAVSSGDGREDAENCSFSAFIVFFPRTHVYFILPLSLCSCQDLSVPRRAEM